MFNFTKKLILVLLVVQLNLNSCYSQVALYGQCGGIGYTGSKTCISSTCYVQNPYYSQCLTSCPSGWSCVATTAQSVTQGSNTVTVALYGQCGGMGYSGSTVCASGSKCFIQTIYYSQCLTSCPAGWACQSNNPTTTLKPATTKLLTTLAKTTTTTVKPASTTVKPTTTTVKPATTTAQKITTSNSNSQVTVPLYGQCGGTGYTGSTVCAKGYTCYVQSQYYSQCLPSCPSGWACQPSNPTTLPASTSSNGPTGSTAPTVSTSPGTLGPTLAPSALFPKCQFRYGRDYAGDSIDYSAYDYITIWIDTISSNCPGSNSGNPDCTNFNPWYQGAMLTKTKALNKIAVFYAYIIAFEARNLAGLQDCNVGSPSLCQYGAQFIRNNRARIIERYNNHSANIASYLGSTYTCIFLIEPDFWQYYGDPSQNGGTLSGAYMRQLYDDIGMTIKKNLPNALISWDISAWIGQSGMTTWWSFFQTSPYVDFINTSGGQSHGELTQIVPNELSWSFMSSLTGRKIIADSGYGVAGGYSDNRAPWYVQSNLDARIADGVISVTLSNSNQNPTYKPKLC